MEGDGRLGIGPCVSISAVTACDAGEERGNRGDNVRSPSVLLGSFPSWP